MSRARASFLKISFLGNESGSVLVITALVLGVLLGMSALVIDAAYLYLQRQRLVNAADASALAGIQELNAGSEAALEVARDYALQNGMSLPEIVVSALPDGNGLRVELTRDVSLFFGRIFGLTTTRVVAASSARAGAISAYVGATPFGVLKDNYVYGEQYYLKEGPGTAAGVYKGNYKALALGGTGARKFEDNVKYGYNQQLKANQWVLTETGNMSGPTGRGIDYRIAQDPHSPPCSFPNIRQRCPLVVVVPVIDSLDVNGRSEVLVVGFAAFFLEDTVQSGGDSYLVGRFMRMAVEGEQGMVTDYGLVSYRLGE
ncbi:MAG: pilus assembly protein [Firmicutes bacterium]|nr:pilus assembly protein [Bacillota bacterium]